MTMLENLQRKENAIIFAPNYADFVLSIKCAIANIALWNSESPNYLKWFTNGGISITK